MDTESTRDMDSAENNSTKRAIETKKFKQFDIATDFSDHHYYLQENGKGPQNQAESAAHKKIMKEWKILEENLPESIFVRVYEGRIDLLRAVIVGVAGTPYSDGLFFFDMKFPSCYPNEPPLVNYRSHGLHLNPNLYDNGFVCLSLLNTWSGDINERWDPSSSTILQVLLSLQALVLNEEPYYNEPVRHNLDRTSSANQRLSRGYNERVSLLSHKTMQYIRKNPPKNFEGFVVDHIQSVKRSKSLKQMYQELVKSFNLPRACGKNGTKSADKKEKGTQSKPLWKARAIFCLS